MSIEFMSIEILNLKTEKPSQLYDIRVDRGFSVLANSYYMKNENSREHVINLYNKWLFVLLRNKDEDIIGEFKRLSNIYDSHNKLRLFCWCAPKPCHAETIRNYLIYGTFY